MKSRAPRRAMEITEHWLAKAAALVALLIAFCSLRIGSRAALINVDENIVWAVARSMRDRGDLNANWRLAEGIMPYFKVDMHNFYSYNLLGLLFLRDTELQTVSALRTLNVGMQLAALTMLWFALRNAGISYWRRILTLAGLAVLPTMVFDAHIARAESFLYLLLAAFVLIASLERRTVLRWAACGLIIGVGVASKLTFLLVALVLLPEFLRQCKSDWRGAIYGLAGALLASAIAFSATSPYTLLEPRVFWHGVSLLMTQYSTAHLPHSNPGSHIGDWAAHLTLFALILTGGAVALIRIPRGSPSWILGLGLMAMVTYAYFCTKPVFFERNISLALAASIVIAFALTRGRLANCILAISFVVMGYWSVNVASLVRQNPGERVAAWESRKFGQPVTRTWPRNDAADLLANCKAHGKVIGVHDYGDSTSARIRSEIPKKPLIKRRGAFYPLPTSTFDTYLDTSVYYYLCG